MGTEEKNKCCGSATCVAGQCDGVHGSICHGHLLKKVVTLVVMIFIFWLGQQVGEVHSYTRMQRANNMMYGNSGYNNFGGGYRMMDSRGAWSVDVAPGTVEPQAAIGAAEKAK